MAKLYWQRFGSGPALVMVHGWAMHSGIWTDFAKQLGQSFQVHCVDLPGHGRSDTITAFTLDNITQQIADSCDLASAHWLGWSLGGNVVMEMAKQYPQRVDSMVVLAGNPCFCATQDWPGIDPKVLDLFGENLNSDCQATLQRFLALQTKGLANAKGLLNQLKAAVNEYQTPNVATLQGGLEILKSVDQRPDLSKLSCPALMILGEQDTLVPARVGNELLGLVPHWQVQLVERAGHLPFLTQADLVSQLICDFLMPPKPT